MLSPVTKRKASHMRPFLISLSCFLMASGHCFGDEVSNYIKRQMDRQHVVGLSFAVVKNARLITAKGYGLADVEFRVPVSNQTAFDIASIAKQFTATATLMLVEQGKIRLDDRITNYLADLPKAWSDVTIRHVLTHTSGIKNFTDLQNFKELVRSHISTQELIKMMGDYPLGFPPGEKWAYSNTGYHLLAEIIENVSGKHYDIFLKEHIFEPLGMASTSLDDGVRIITNRANGYSWQNGELRKADYSDPSWAQGAGGAISTALDLAKWDAALYTQQLLPKQRFEQMWTAVTLNGGDTFPYGFGWYVYKMDSNHRLLAHSGFDFGFNSCIYRWIDDGTTIIVLLTGGTPLLSNGSDSADDIAWGISRRYIPRLRDKAIKDDDLQRTARLKSALTAIIGRTLDPELLAEGIRKQWPSKAGKLASELKDIGVMRSFELVRKENDGSSRQYRYRARFPKDSLLFSVNLDKAQNIIDMDIEIE